MRETPDIETATDEYASRFAGAAGRYFLAHRACRGARPLQWAEALGGALGLTRLFGSPVILRADRVA